NILVATGNGYWNGRQYWGDSVLELSPKGGGLVHTFTPTDQAQLDATDTDVGSTSPAIIRKRGPVVLQGGKDGKLRVISMARRERGTSSRSSPWLLGTGTRRSWRVGGSRCRWATRTTTQRRGRSTCSIPELRPRSPRAPREPPRRRPARRLPRRQPSGGSGHRTSHRRASPAPGPGQPRAVRPDRPSACSRPADRRRRGASTRSSRASSRA